MLYTIEDCYGHLADHSLSGPILGRYRTLQWLRTLPCNHC
jgi:hypothetical protein